MEYMYPVTILMDESANPNYIICYDTHCYVIHMTHVNLSIYRTKYIDVDYKELFLSQFLVSW